MKRIILLITILFATLVVQVKTAEAGSFTIRSTSKNAKWFEYIGLRISHSTSNAGTKFEFMYQPQKSNRIIVWHYALVTPVNKDGSAVSVI